MTPLTLSLFDRHDSAVWQTHLAVLREGGGARIVAVPTATDLGVYLASSEPVASLCAIDASSGEMQITREDRLTLSGLSVAELLRTGTLVLLRGSIQLLYAPEV